MPKVSLEEAGCRDCSLCVDICPTKVFDRDEARTMALVAREVDCIGCTSCQYVCPSRCITVTDFPAQRPFHRIELNASLVAKFLQHQPVTSALSAADLDEALADVSVRLHALGDSVTETMGRGQKAVGRKAGALAAAHLPEMYEGRTIEEVMQRLRARFAGSFEFDAQVADAGTAITMTFPRCALARVVERRGETVGQAQLCGLFHEYWAGLVGAFTNNNYAIESVNAGKQCTMKLQARG